MRACIDSAIDTAFNPVGTARMGAADDEAAVVDQYCGVYGTEGLYVADTSVMPPWCARTLAERADGRGGVVAAARAMTGPRHVARPVRRARLNIS